MRLLFLQFLHYQFSKLPFPLYFSTLDCPPVFTGHLLGAVKIQKKAGTWVLVAETASCLFNIHFFLKQNPFIVRWISTLSYKIFPSPPCRCGGQRDIKRSCKVKLLEKIWRIWLGGHRFPLPPFLHLAWNTNMMIGLPEVILWIQQ